MLRYSFYVSVVAFVALAGAVQAAVFADGVFNNSDWTMTTITNTSGTGSTAQGFQVTTGGNPNEFREIKHQLLVNEQLGTGAVLTFHMNNNAFYTPSTQGAITSINYSEDDINFINQPGDGQVSGLAIYQNGKFYRQQNPLLLMPYAGYATWATNAAPGLVATDFAEVTLAGIVTANTPDFSATGPIMQFGFHRGNSGNGGYSTDTGIDNWRVAVVPEPGAVSILCLASLVAARRRRA